MSGFTPGPWVPRRAVKPDNTGGYDWAIIAPDKAIVAECFEVVDWAENGVDFDTRPVEANARLIASAPDLLEALEGFISWGTKQCPCENEDPNPCPLCGASVENLETCKAIESKFPRIILAKARAAIAKALGEQA